MGGLGIPAIVGGFASIQGTRLRFLPFHVGIVWGSVSARERGSSSQSIHAGGTRPSSAGEHAFSNRIDPSMHRPIRVDPLPLVVSDRSCE
jgi:hypothetical protein